MVPPAHLKPKIVFVQYYSTPPLPPAPPPPPLHQIEEKLRSLVIQHGIRLLKLRCFEAEIKARIRWVLSSEGGITMTMKWDHCQLHTRAAVTMVTHSPPLDWCLAAISSMCVCA